VRGVDRDARLTANGCPRDLARDLKSMSIPGAIEAALKRLASALDHLDAAAERQAAARAERGDAAEEYAIMRDDRARLALELEGAMSRMRRLERANDEAVKRIERASEAIRATLGDDEPVEETPADDGEA
jgi:chromosome segregation ATPase